jgi:hypothetical protein
MTCNSLLIRLIERGDEIWVENGCIKLVPSGIRPVPTGWLEKHLLTFQKDILQIMGLEGYHFESYTCGYYVKKNPMEGGITLQFVDIETGKNAHAIFNVDLKRVRSTRHGKKAMNYPKKDLLLVSEVIF